MRNYSNTLTAKALVARVRENHVIPPPEGFNKIEHVIRKAQRSLSDIYESRACYDDEQFASEVSSVRDKFAKRIFSILGIVGNDDLSVDIFERYVRQPVWVKNKKIFGHELRHILKSSPPKLRALLETIAGDSSATLEYLKEQIGAARDEDKEALYKEHADLCAEKGEPPGELEDFYYPELGDDRPSYFAMKFVAAHCKDENSAALDLIDILLVDNDAEECAEYIVMAFAMDNAPAYARIMEVCERLRAREEEEEGGYVEDE